MKKNKKLEISDEMIGATDGKTCCSAFADPLIQKGKKVKPPRAKKKPHSRSAKYKQKQ